MPINEHKPDKCLVFDLKGPMAHFRKYYTNSSSLSYLVPPRTVIAGLIAGLLGLPSEKHITGEQEAYYERFNDNNCFISVSLRSRIRRMMQTVNYLKTTSISALDGSSGGTQIPLEILVPEERDQDIVYRIYFYHRDDKEIYDTFKKRLENQSFLYPPYLGLSEFLASIDYIGEGKVDLVSKKEIDVTSTCRLADVDLNFEGNDFQYLTEKMPVNFLNDRTPQKPDDYVIEAKGKMIKATLKSGYMAYVVSYPEKSTGVSDCIMPM